MFVGVISHDLSHQVSRALLDAQSPSLRLTPLSSPYKDVLAYHQGNAIASRKKLLPVLKDFLSNWERRQVHCGEVGEELEVQFGHLDTISISDSLPGNSGTSPDLADDLRPRVYSASRHHRRRLLVAEDCGTEEDCGLGAPPTPMNSLVDGCPLDGGFSQEALLEKFSKMAGGEEKGGDGH